MATVILKARGLEPDTKLSVFDTEFLVSSTILKLHSHYFFTFLDSADKPPSAGGTFKYHWITKVDGDGKGWQLVCKTPKFPKSNSATYIRKAEEEVEAFHKLLLAFHGQPFGLKGCEELISMIQLAKFYAALPLLSRSLQHKNLDRVSKLFQQRPFRVYKVLDASVDLRHPELFRLAFTWALGPWTFPNFRCLDQESPGKNLAQLKYYQLCAEIAEIQKAVYENIGRGDESYEFTETLRDAGKQDMERKRFVSLPSFYRKVRRDLESEVDSKYEKLKFLLDNLLKNNLVFGRDLVAGEGPAENHFLCVTVDDNELPWDRTQIDW